jgi:hypothetical protein
VLRVYGKAQVELKSGRVSAPAADVPSARRSMLLSCVLGDSRASRPDTQYWCTVSNQSVGFRVYGVGLGFRVRLKGFWAYCRVQGLNPEPKAAAWAATSRAAAAAAAAVV